MRLAKMVARRMARRYAGRLNPFIGAPIGAMQNGNVTGQLGRRALDYYEARRAGQSVSDRVGGNGVRGDRVRGDPGSPGTRRHVTHRRVARAQRAAGRNDARSWP